MNQCPDDTDTRKSYELRKHSPKLPRCGDMPLTNGACQQIGALIRQAWRMEHIAGRLERLSNISINHERKEKVLNITGDKGCFTGHEGIPANFDTQV